MTQTVSDKEVQETRKRVDKLREQIRDQRTKAAEQVHDGENAIVKAQLDTEAARLEAELAALKEATKVSVVREQQEGLFAQVQSPTPTQAPAPGQNEGV